MVEVDRDTFQTTEAQSVDTNGSVIKNQTGQIPVTNPAVQFL